MYVNFTSLLFFPFFFTSLLLFSVLCRDLGFCVQILGSRGQTEAETIFLTIVDKESDLELSGDEKHKHQLKV